MIKEKEPYINLKKQIQNIKQKMQHDFDSYRMGIVNTKGIKQRLTTTSYEIQDLVKRLQDNKKY